MQILEAASPNVSHIQVGDIRVELWTSGTGRPILFLHPGDGLDAEATVLQRLAERNRIIAPAHPGFGGTDLPSYMTSVDDLSYFYLDLMEQLDLSDVVVLGVSFGAWIAAEIAVKSTARIAGLVLADALGVKFGPVTTREIADLFAYPQYEQARMLYSDAARQRQSFAHLPDDTLARLARNHESFALFGWSPTLHNPKLNGRLHRIDVPTLVLWGAQDGVVPPASGEQLAKAIPGATFQVIDQAGHYAHVEQPDLFVEAVERFVASLSGS